MRRLSIRLKSLANAFPDWKISEAVRDSFLGRYAGGNVEAYRTLGTSNVADLDLEGWWLREPIMRSPQEEIVSALRSGDRNKASNLLSDLGSASQTLQAKDFVYILRYCAREPDPLFVMETWKLMEEKDIKLSDKCYFLAIRALCKAGYLKEAFNILSLRRENSEIYPTLPIYNNLLGGCIQRHSFNLASECLQLMEEQGVGKNLITYGLLLKLAVLQQDLFAVHNIWKECMDLQSLSIITLRKFIWSFTMLRDLESAYMALQQMVALALQHKCSITKTAEGKLFDSRLDIPIPSPNVLSSNRNGKSNFTYLPCGSEHYCIKDSNLGDKFGMVAYKDGSLSQQPFSGPVMKLLRWSFGDIIHACANSQNVMLAKQLMLQMQNLHLEPSSGTYDGFVKSLVSVKDFYGGIDVLKIMQQKSMKPFDSTLAVLSVSCSRGLELDLAENFLHQMSSCRHAYTFNAFLEACNILDRPERAVRALVKMKYLNVLPDIRTYELMFSLFGNVNAPYEDGNVLSQAVAAKRINIIEKDMMRQGIQHSRLSLQNLLNALGMEGMTKDLIQHLHVAEDRFLHRSSHIGIHIYNTVLHSLVEAKENYLAVEIFKSIIPCGLSPDVTTYNIMIDCCSTINCYDSACALVSLMVRHGFFPGVLTYTALIKILLNFEDFNEALRLLDQAYSEGIQPDLVLYNTILQLASDKGRIDVIELVVAQMHLLKIQPDPSTCSHVFLAYIHNGYYSTALEALQVLCMRMISEQDDVLEEHQSQYEDLLFYDNLEAESQIVEVFKHSEYLSIALLYLRWCATLGFPISWLPNQSPWAMRLSSDYPSKRHG